MAGTSYTWNFVPPIGNVGPNNPPQSPQHGTFAGMSTAQLAAFRTAAQTALVSLVTGQQSVTVAYNSGDGHKSVTYARPQEASLRGLIAELNALLGAGRRKPIGIAFR